MIFSSIFLHAVTFSHVLHLDVLRRQIELRLKVVIEISLCMAIMHCHPYIHSTTVLCDVLLEMMMSVLQEVNGLTKKLILHYTSSRKTSFHAKVQVQYLHGFPV